MFFTSICLMISMLIVSPFQIDFIILFSVHSSTDLSSNHLAQYGHKIFLSICFVRLSIKIIMILPIFFFYQGQNLDGKLQNTGTHGLGIYVHVSMFSKQMTHIEMY